MVKIAGDKITIGLEVHCQLTSLRTKLFCSCSANYRDEEPNVLVCPTCMGLPGSLPVLNIKAIEYASKIAIALGSKLSDRMIFFRKNYFYPDLPKNFQITQYHRGGSRPISVGGFIALDDGYEVRLTRMQLEEDPAKITYEGTITSSSYSLVDYNRAGIALVEIVTEPDLRSPRQAREFLEKLRSILEHLVVFDGGLEGSMRCDANISMYDRNRVEVKNISSFKEVERALSFEITRQTRLSKNSGEASMETRHWDDDRRVTVSLRSKEEEEDYRYFPEPDLLPVSLSKKFLSGLEKEIPELPDARRERFIKELNVSSQNSRVLTSTKSLADLFEETVSIYESPKRISNWIAGDILAYMNRSGKSVKDLNISPTNLAELVKMVDEKILIERSGKNVMYETLMTGKSPREIVEEKNLEHVSDKNYIEDIVSKVFKDNPNPVRDALNNDKAINYLVGLAMKISNGKADPNETREKIEMRLSDMINE